MLQAQRHIEILNRLKVSPFLSTKQLALELNVSEMTIRRDFKDMASKGIVLREHGGAILAGYKQEQLDLSAPISKQQSASSTTALVVRKALQHIKEGDCVFLDASKSAMMLLPHLIKFNMTIVIHSSLNLHDYESVKAEVIMLGGSYNFSTQATYGPIGINILQNFSFSSCFLSCYALELESGKVFCVNTNGAQIKTMVMKQTSKKILLAEKVKFNRSALFRYANIEEFDYLISDYQGLDQSKIPSSTKIELV